MRRQTAAVSRTPSLYHCLTSLLDERVVEAPPELTHPRVQPLEQSMEDNELEMERENL
jgi:hypothetical protein